MPTRKVLLKQIDEFTALFRDPKTGLAWVEDRRVGVSYSAHPNIANSGSVRGMKLKGYWARDAEVVYSRGFIHNISRCAVNLDNPLEVLAMESCRCGGVHYDTEK